MRISVIGAGYVGLVSGACLAEKGHQVVCVDVDREKVEKINKGVAPIYEEGLEELLRKNVPVNLTATLDLETAVMETDVSFITVPTPSTGNEIGLSYITQAAQQIGKALSKKSTYHLVVVKSTVLPGTTDEVVLPILERSSGKKAGIDFGLGMNPEFLREGQAVQDCLFPDRLVLGGIDEKSTQLLAELYTVFEGVPQLRTSIKTAEMTKYATNALLATLISFSNEVANLSGAVPGIDVRQVWRGVHLDRRITPVGAERSRAPGIIEYLWHGLGFGGSCLPKDVAALRGFGRRCGTPTPLLDAVLATNELQPLQLVSLLEREMVLAERTVAVLGLAFKPGTDDLRKSPALPVVAALRQRGARVVAHDPVAMPNAQRNPGFSGIGFAPCWEKALSGADACCLITRWPEYGAIRPKDFVRLMRRPLVIDGRGIFDPEMLAVAGVTWRGIGYTPEPRVQDTTGVKGSQDVPVMQP